METPRHIILVEPIIFPALEEFCGGMDVTNVLVYGFPGFGFFDEDEVHEAIDFLVGRGMTFRLLSDATPNPDIPSPPTLESQSLRRSPESAER